MKVKTPVKYHLSSVRMVTVKKTNDNTCSEDVEERKPLHLVDGNEYCHILYQKQMELPKKLKMATN